MKATVFIDGGYLRALGQKAGYRYTPDLIETVAVGCVSGEETLLRVLYYDCAPYTGDPPLPVSGAPANFRGSDAWLRELAAKPLFAVRLGTLKFRGFIAKRTPINPNELSDGDFKPRFEQKGVDMRLGLDIATHAMNGSVDRIILVTGDTDCLPAMKFARTAGCRWCWWSSPGNVLHGNSIGTATLPARWCGLTCGRTRFFRWVHVQSRSAAFRGLPSVDGESVGPAHVEDASREPAAIPTHQRSVRDSLHPARVPRALAPPRPRRRLLRVDRPPAVQPASRGESGWPTTRPWRSPDCGSAGRCASAPFSLALAESRAGRIPRGV